jgi:NAD(P)-dependent dehydrogenase (short-subunit alcohol dehydrogenase family)
MTARPHALVTGATSDLGSAIARALAPDWSLTLTGRDGARLTAIATELGADAVPGDLADPAFRAALTAGVRDGHGPPGHAGHAGIRGFVHAASHRFDYQRFHAVAPDDAAAQRALDFDAPIALLTALVPEMMANRHGRIVLVSSLAAQVAGDGATLYTAHKAGLEGLVRGLAVEYGRFGVTANAVAPGPIETSRLALRTTPESRARLVAATAVRRLARPEDVAGAVAFLMSPAAAYITGITLPVTGGLHLHTRW